MREFHWRLDECLSLAPCAAEASELDPLDVPEQAVDTVLLRNLDVVLTALFGSPGHFIFHSALYWGEFDVCCILTDGRLIAFENKGRWLTKKDFTKFCRDVRRIQAGGHEHVKMRYEHVLNGMPGYRMTAERMFAAAFLGVRCDVEKDARNLTDEACSKLSISREEFQRRFHSRNGWLKSLDSRPAFDEYLRECSGTAYWLEFIPVLLVPSADIVSVQDWSQGLDDPSGVTAHLATFRFSAEIHGIPLTFSIRQIGEFRV